MYICNLCGIMVQLRTLNITHLELYVDKKNPGNYLLHTVVIQGANTP